MAVCLVNLGYGFEGTLENLGEYEFISNTLAGPSHGIQACTPGTNRFAGTYWSGIPVPFPRNYLMGIDRQKCDFERGMPSYLRGQWADHGWWYYYLYALAIKLPLGTWCLVALAIGATTVGRRYSASWRDETVVLAPFFAILVLVSSQTGFSVHSRYVIPALPFLFVWMSKVARVSETYPSTRRCLAMTAIVVLALTWSVGSSLAVYPHSLSYFNELVGGPRGGAWHLLDSNIDWGQDLRYLKDWLDAHPDVKLDGLAYWGSCPAALASVPETPYPAPAPDCPGPERSHLEEQLGPEPGWHALSVNHVYGRSGRYGYFLRFEPVATAGYSIYIYRISSDEVNRIRRDLGIPELKPEKPRNPGERRADADKAG